MKAKKIVEKKKEEEELTIPENTDGGLHEEAQESYEEIRNPDEVEVEDITQKIQKEDEQKQGQKVDVYKQGTKEGYKDELTMEDSAKVEYLLGGEDKIAEEISKNPVDEAAQNGHEENGGGKKTEDIRELVKTRDFYDLTEFSSASKELISDIKKYEKKYENTDV